jgi:hypothetical protein
MNERYRNLEASIESKVAPPARRPELIPKYVVTKAKEEFLCLGHWGISCLLFILTYVAA